MEEVDRYYQGNITLEEAESYIASGMMTAARAFVANGYYLRRIRDEKLYKESGYKNFKEYLEDRYRKDEGWASKCIKVNQQLSVGCNSPILDSKYCDYNDKYKLVELASMTEEQRDQVSPDMSVKALREFRKGEDKNLVTSQENQAEENKPEVMDAVQEVATVETPKPDPAQQKWNPIPTPCIHREGYSCTVPEAQKYIPGDGSSCGRSCCWECTKRGACKWECNSSQLRPEEPDPPKQISELDFSCRTENTLKRAGIDTVEELASMSDEELVAIRGMSDRTLEEIRTKLEDKPEPESVVDAEYEEVQPDHSERVYTLEEVAQEIYRLEAAYMGAPEEVQKSSHYRKNMMRLDAMRLLYEDMKDH